MRIVILGAPGAGKRSQSALLAEKLDLTIVATGDLLKKAIEEESRWGLEAKALQDAGHVVTEDIILGLLREQLLHPAMANGFILDGFPRNLLQALTLDELLLEIGKPLDRVLLIDIDNDHLMERLVGRRACRSCGQLYNVYRNPPIVEGVCDVCGGRLHQRSDDNEETVSSRIHVFDHLIAPLITHYTKSDKLIRVDGNGSLEQVFENLMGAIKASRTSTNQAKPTQSNVDNRADKASNSAEKALTRKSKTMAEKKGAESKTATETDQPAKESKETKKSSAKKTAGKVASVKKRPQVAKKKKVSKKTTSKPNKQQKTAAQNKKKVKGKSQSAAKAVKKTAAKQAKPLTRSKSAAVAKSATRPSTKKGKASASAKKSAPSKKKITKKRPKAKLSKKLTKKKPLTKKAQKATGKKRLVTKKKLTTKRAGTSQAKKVTAKSAKKRVVKQNKSARKKALKRKTKK